MNHKIRSLMDQVEHLESTLDAACYRRAIARYKQHGELPSNALLRAWLRSWRADLVAAWSTLGVDVTDRYPEVPE